jgi:hypothetical protein
MSLKGTRPILPTVREKREMIGDLEEQEKRERKRQAKKI